MSLIDLLIFIGTSIFVTAAMMRRGIREPREVDDDEVPRKKAPRPKPPKPEVLRVSKKTTIHPAPPPPRVEVEKPSRAKTMVGSLSTPKDMLVYYEIFGPPKAYRDD